MKICPHCLHDVEPDQLLDKPNALPNGCICNPNDCLGLKLFVWEDVLSDYTDGIMFALAESVDDARSIIMDEARMDGYNTKLGHTDIELIQIELKAEPKVYNGKVGFFVFGGA
jgi:hypothetical protein